MVRAPFYDGSGLKKGAWSLEEDNKLRAYIERYGHGNWRELPKFAGISRCGKSCRLRWTNYLQPGVKRGHYTQQEDELIIRLHEEFGNKWSIIAAKLPGRTDNDIKNHWHTHIGNRTKQNPTSSQVKEQSCDESPPSETRRNSELEAQSASVHQIFESSPLSPSETFSSTEYSSLSCNDHGPVSTINCLADEDSLASSMSETILEDSSGDFWTQPFQQDNMYVQSNYPIISYSELGEQEGILSSPYVMLYDIIDGMDLFYQVMPKFQDN